VVNRRYRMSMRMRQAQAPDPIETRNEFAS
jgi:hypothetical protein